MADGLSLNLQLLQNISDMTGGTAAGAGSANSKPAVYAKEGDPNYDEKMDADGDGVVTMEEYQEYCKENGISTDEQAAEMQSRGDAMIKNKQRKLQLLMMIILSTAKKMVRELFRTQEKQKVPESMMRGWLYVMLEKH